MSKFRLPRKIKKILRDEHLLYPPMEDGSRMVAFPDRNQEDYHAYKMGILSPFFEFSKKDTKNRMDEYEKMYYKEIEVSDEELLALINSTFGKEYREDAFSTFKRAKNHPLAVRDYYSFVNSAKLGEDLVACLSLDSANDNLMRKKPRK